MKDIEVKAPIILILEINSDIVLAYFLPGTFSKVLFHISDNSLQLF